MKILLIHDYGTPTGGAELQMLGLREAFRQRGHEVRLFSSTASLSPGEVLAEHTCFGTTGRLQKLSQVANPSAYIGLRRVLADFRPDVVHVRIFEWQLSPLILPLLRHVPAVYQAAMYKMICPLGTKLLPGGADCTEQAGVACLRHGCVRTSWPMMMAQLALLKRWRGVFDCYTALSAAVRERLEGEGIGPVEVIPNGVPERPMRPALGPDPVIVYGGRLSREKGVDVLLRAVRKLHDQLPGVRLLIAGEGPQQAELLSLSEELGVAERVTWLGYLPREQMEHTFERAWVQVVPSVWEEPFGNVTTEAMMRGTAVVASAVGAQPDIVVDGVTGYLVPPGDVDALTLRLTALAGDRAAAERMGAAGRARALECYSEDRCAERFLEVYRRLLESARSRSESDGSARPDGGRNDARRVAADIGPQC